jgi:hypothetical protein
LNDGQPHYSFLCRAFSALQSYASFRSPARTSSIRHRLSRSKTVSGNFLSSTATMTSRCIITPSFPSASTRLEVLAWSSVVPPIVSVCQSGCLHGLLFFLPLTPSDDTVTVQYPVSEGTSFGAILPVFCQLMDLREAESSVSCISG